MKKYLYQLVNLHVKNNGINLGHTLQKSTRLMNIFKPCYNIT